MKVMPAIAAEVFGLVLGWFPVGSWGPTAYAIDAATRKRLITGSVDNSQRRRPRMSMDLPCG